MLKLIAVLTMVIDHIGYLFFPDQEWMRAIGRLTMPIFGYAIARGFFYTRDSKGYLLRVAALAVISQLPFMLLFGGSTEFQIGDWSFWFPLLNMVVPWALALLLLHFPPLAVFPIVLVLLYVPMDYTSLVILLPIALYHFWFRERRPVLALLSTAAILSGISLVSFPLQWWSLLAIPLIYFLEPYDGKLKLNRWFFYSFYPAHMLLLLIPVYLIGSPSS